MVSIEKNLSLKIFLKYENFLELSFTKTEVEETRENFVSRAEDLIKFDDFREQQNKVLPFLSSEYGENNETSSAKRLQELSCIKEEDHVEFNESFKQNKTIISKENLDVNEDSQLSFNISNTSRKNYSRLPSIYFKRTETSEHDSTLTNVNRTYLLII